MGEHYKVQIIEELPVDEEISVYQQGDWMDPVGDLMYQALENWALSN